MNSHLSDAGVAGPSSIDPVTPPATGLVCRSLDRLERLVDELTASWVNGQSLFSRRYHRVTFRQEIAIAALADDGLTPCETPRRANTTDISHGGLSFEHTRSLACRLIAVTVFPHGRTAESFVMRLKWCRFTRSGIYRSGGKFLRPQKFGWEGDLRLSELAAG